MRKTNVGGETGKLTHQCMKIRCNNNTRGKTGCQREGHCPALEGEIAEGFLEEVSLS